MRILLITYYYNQTASGIISRRIAEALSNLGVEVIVVSSSKNRDYTYSNIKYVECSNLFEDQSIIKKIGYRIAKLFYAGIFNYNPIWRKKTLRLCSKIIKQYKPDFVYCRTTPIDACMVGADLRKLYHIKTLMHFTDPIPAPVPHITERSVREKLSKKADYIIKNSDFVSFGTQQMLDYQKTLSKYLDNKRVFVSPDAASSDTIKFTSFQSGFFILTYLGSISGTRSSKNLFEAIKTLNSDGKKISLKIYSKRPIGEPVCEGVNYVGSTDNVQKALVESNCYVDIDGNDTPPVFISSKLKDYLINNRPIISITPIGSPSQVLLNNLKTVQVCQDEKEQIIRCIENLYLKNIENAEYIERTAIVEQFSPKRIANQIISVLKNG